MQDNVFDVAFEEINSSVTVFSCMKTYRDVDSLIKMLMSEVNMIVNNDYTYYAKNRDSSLLIIIQKDYDYFRYIKIVGITKNVKMKIKECIDNSEHREVVTNLFSKNSYSSPRSFKRYESCTLL